MVLLSILSNAEFTGAKRVNWAPRALSSLAIPEDSKRDKNIENLFCPKRTSRDDFKLVS